LLLLKKVKFLSLIFLVAAKVFFIITLHILAVQVCDTETSLHVGIRFGTGYHALKVAMKVEL